MAFRTQKISQMTPKGSDLEATDLIEVSTIESGSYVTRSITGQELIDAIPLPPSGITIGATAIASGANGRFLFDDAGVVSETNGAFWDKVNGRFGLGTSTPAANKILDIRFDIGSFSAGAGVGIRNINSQGYSELVFDNDTTPTTSGAFVFGYAGTGTPITNTAYFFQRRNAPILFGTNDTNRMTIYGTGNIGINTTTDAGFRLDVNGTARFIGNTQTFGTNRTQGSLLVGTSISGNAGLVGIDQSGTGSASRIYMHNSAGSVTTLVDAGGASYFNGGNVGIGTSSPAYVLDVVGGFRIGSSTIKLGMGESGGNSVFVGSLTNQPLKFLVNTNEYARIATTGNVLINTTTDAGFRLDVNGTARVSGNTTLAGTNSLTGTTNISGIFSNWACHYTSGATSKPLSFSAQSGGGTPNNVAIQFGFNFRAAGGLFSQDIFQNILYDNTANNIVTGFEWFTHQKQLGDLASVLAMSLRGKTLSLGTNTPSESSLLQMDSTTKGFLPPRMTTTEKNAIATPATGLQIFDTTLNRPCFYDGTTWITL